MTVTSSTFDPHTSFGPLHCGVVVANILFGILTLQANVYYKKFPHDRRLVKILVAVVWVLEVSHSICYIHGLYVMIIRLRGQMIDSVPTSFSVGYFFSGMVGPIVQVLKRICFKFLA